MLCVLGGPRQEFPWQLVSEEAGLDFISIREEAYDLRIPQAYDDDPLVDMSLTR